MTAERYALAILNAIQAAESAGFMVEVSNGRCAGLTVADVILLTEPDAEDEPWDMVMA